MLAILGITIEVVPIKVSPLKWLGNRLNHSLNKRLDKVEQDVQELKKTSENANIQHKRTAILDFANSCRNGRRHTIEEFEHYISLIDEYHQYTNEHGIENGVIDVQSNYIKTLYSKLLENDECDEKYIKGGLLHYYGNEYKD